ncbi:TPA: DUF551 domain-containing protein [Enterobacter ludwigii]|uniref:DUF551 domain-containing protein n=1 Tax=Enterobacter ludwigii TaxID=299767 RepID=UPI0032FD5D69|nr:DUF551 domain-containing protein [Enterobacter ludwigii]
MSTTLKEWLVKTITELEEERDAVPGAVNEDAAKALAAMKLALASLDAEPVGFIARHKETGKFGSYLHPKADWFKNDDYEVLSAYTAPPAPVSVPDAMTPKQASRAYCGEVRGYRDGWNACRAAMLQGAEPVTTAYKLPFEQWLSQQTGTIDVECGCVMTEVFFHWLRVAYEAGNSPVIPYGWVACNERMPGIGTEIFYFCQDDGLRDCGIVSSSNFSGKGDAELYVHAEGYDLRFGVDITHWMPLPAAPQQEVK